MLTKRWKINGLKYIPVWYDLRDLQEFTCLYRIPTTWASTATEILKYSLFPNTGERLNEKSPSFLFSETSL